MSQPGDDVFYIAGHLQTNAKRDAIYEAVSAVCTDIAEGRSVTACVWDAPSSWGIQVADYGLWSTQRELLGKPVKWHEACIKPSLRSFYRPWDPTG
ncbi:hypothetical protein PZ938_02060 [Luteipulveratus sp. YIM 133132]|uniref:ABM domain-containing protein n=1 Tax=Luteipulveratus flavus TaxID=3031728 RepID=A0ABT6C8Z1_9MICO|nr:MULTISPECIES: hypothetical protein [unclassified Luteipulveratus]MDE9364378.1 hypothetical protein [Luteipulveratus sp. YIM 133132]MDF8265191.1 hypothetical protein [Luteipulveratus sp. YIM 133296]